jgi:hypothetical protein
MIWKTYGDQIDRLQSKGNQMAVEEILLEVCLAVQMADHVLLEIKAREETLSHRLGVYLEPYFSKFSVDCEYNKADDEPKRFLAQPDFTCQNLLNSGLATTN